MFTALVTCWLLLITEFLVFQTDLHFTPKKHLTNKSSFYHIMISLKLAPFNVYSRLTRREQHKKVQVRLIFENVPVSEKYVL